MAKHSSAGDPSGRRLAKHRAALLSEAAHVGRALEVLLNRAMFPGDVIQQLIRDVAKQEQIELQRGFGRVEPRSRFKGQSGHPLLDSRIVNLLFIDESGRSFPEPKQAASDVFALGAVAMSEPARDTYCKAADALKMNFFGRTDFALHEPFMRQRYQDPKSQIDYSFNLDTTRQREFDAAIERLISETDFVTFGVGIRKFGFQADFVATGIDPYLPTDAYALAIMLLLERYVDMLATASGGSLGRVTFESQGSKEDAFHQLEYARVLLDGSQWVPDAAFRNWLETGLQFAPKAGSHPVELADLFSRDLFEWTRSGCTAAPKWWKPYCSKVYVRGDGLMGKFGIKVFPDSDIREAVIAHRRACGAA